MDTYFAPLRDSDGRSVDSIDRGIAHQQTMSKLRWVATHPGVAWLLALVLCIALSAGGGYLVVLGYGALDELPPWLQWLVVTTGFGVVFAYPMMLGIEGRKPAELLRFPVVFLAAGLVLGTALMCVSLGVIYLLGGMEFGGFRGDVHWLGMLLILGIAPAISEEILFRGLIYRYLEQLFGTWIATGISGAMFGLAHLGNPDASLWGALAIAIEAGLLFAALYTLFRSMWLVMGLHCAWNFVQGAVFDINVSGTGEIRGWIITDPVGNELLSGGAFGIEASVVTVVVCSLVTLWAIVMIVRHGNAVPPVWGQRRYLQSQQEIPA